MPQATCLRCSQPLTLANTPPIPGVAICETCARVILRAYLALQDLSNVAQDFLTTGGKP